MSWEAELGTHLPPPQETEQSDCSVCQVWWNLLVAGWVTFMTLGSVYFHAIPGFLPCVRIWIRKDKIREISKSTPGTAEILLKILEISLEIHFRDICKPFWSLSQVISCSQACQMLTKKGFLWHFKAFTVLGSNGVDRCWKTQFDVFYNHVKLKISPSIKQMSH